MDSQATNAVNDNQTRVATAMDHTIAVDRIQGSPPTKTLLATPTPSTPRPLPPMIPMVAPRPPTLMSQTREPPSGTHLQSPPTSDIRNSSLQRSAHTSVLQKESPQHNSSATPTSPPRQPVFPPLREHTPMSETRKNAVPDLYTTDLPTKLFTPTA